MRFETKHGLLALAVAYGLFASSAQACNLGLKSDNIALPSAVRAASTPTADADYLPAHEATVVGLWRSEFLGEDGSNDIGFESFYADGNELLIDNSAPATDNVCSGVWEQTGPRTYVVNHPSWDFDSSGNLIGIVVLNETINVDCNGNTFTGSGSVTVYDPTMTSIVYKTKGVLTGTRITAKSKPL